MALSNKFNCLTESRNPYTKYDNFFYLITDLPKTKASATPKNPMKVDIPVAVVL